MHITNLRYKNLRLRQNDYNRKYRITQIMKIIQRMYNYQIPQIIERHYQFHFLKTSAEQFSFAFERKTQPHLNKMIFIIITLPLSLLRISKDTHKLVS